MFLAVLARKAGSETWHLTIASAIVDRVGPRRSYPTVRRIVVAEQLPVQRGEISLVSPRDPFIREVGRWVRITQGVVAQLGPIRLDEADYDEVYVFK